MREKIQQLITESIKAKEAMLQPVLITALEKISSAIIESYRGGGRFFVFGNGGSAADAQHFSTELVVRFEKNRAALPALALTTNSSLLTATGNDFSFDDVFSRQIEAWVKKGDVVVGISTSGNSPNVIKAIEAARQAGAVTVGFCSAKQAKLTSAADLCFSAPSLVTARVQECHILAVHIICSMIEERLFK